MRSGAVLALLFLMGCGSGMDWQSPWQIALDRLTAEPPAATPGADALRAALTPAAMAQIDVPVLLVQVPQRGAVAVMTRVASTRGVDTYMSGDSISISLRDGILIGTRGLGFDLMVADISAVAPAIAAGAGQGTRTHRYLDGEDQIRVVTYDCRYQRENDAVTEICDGGGLQFRNHYMGVRTVQWVSPRNGALVIEWLKS